MNGVEYKVYTAVSHDAATQHGVRSALTLLNDIGLSGTIVRHDSYTPGWGEERGVVVTIVADDNTASLVRHFAERLAVLLDQEECFVTATPTNYQSVLNPNKDKE